jgi:23S rRNA (uridine2552-2'-O)-methyltransferase
MYNPFDFYFKQAQKSGYKARSAFKLEEIQQKFHIFDKSVKTVMDIGCSPGSWLQYAHNILTSMKVSNPLLVWLDIKSVKVNLPNAHTYVQSVTDRDAVQAILDEHKLSKLDVIISDMAPNTTGVKDMDAMRLFDLLEQSLRLYTDVLKPKGKFVTKIFMWPGFDEYVKRLKDHFGGKAIKIFKPDASRSQSKETYIIKYQ